ncbi:hypothetical protein KAJ02_02915, partial [Candidatus Bipolaricaulota bacterium]|nr:hypothetical protein [Candidatus Bipolaricaulota bacterium]
TSEELNRMHTRATYAAYFTIPPSSSKVGNLSRLHTLSADAFHILPSSRQEKQSECPTESIPPFHVLEEAHVGTVHVGTDQDVAQTSSPHKTETFTAEGAENADDSIDTSTSNLSDLCALYEIQPFLSPVRHTHSSRKDRRGELQ